MNGVNSIPVTMGERYSEKFAYGTFTNNTYITFTAAVWTNRDIKENRPFKEAIVTNNLNTDLFIYTAEDTTRPLTILKALGGAFAFSKADLLGTTYPLLLRNETGSTATSGNATLTMVR